MVQNHLFQVLANLAMEPPVRTDSESIRDEKVKVLKAMSPSSQRTWGRSELERVTPPGGWQNPLVNHEKTP